ncbi:MAG TPA: nucleotide pyrophosphatase/phosphodiesterase family protein [Candidatus Limnocylindria bacterium]|nr:nucleotide pyrophosphatase/phosphodiesterase family protein [Candidatus Limnocylindria bacterium]
MCLPVAAAPVPAYGARSLSDLGESTLAAVGLPAENRLALPEARRLLVLLVDGFGWVALRAHRREAPFLNSVADDGGSLTAPFPSSTAVSISSLGSALPPGEHGVTGYTMALPGLPRRPMNCIGWNEFGVGGDLRSRYPPEEVQPHHTILERAAAAGRETLVLGPEGHAGSGLSRAALRGARHLALETPEALAERGAEAAQASQPGALLYAYLWQLDLAGHVHGPRSAEWLAELQRLDGALERLATALPPGTLLVVTGDHGMVELPEAGRMDPRSEPGLMDGVAMLAGEPRARHVHTRPGAAETVLTAWRERFGERAWIASRDEAIGAGWFGPIVEEAVRPRIGDVVVAARDPIGIVQPHIAPREARLVGHHGSMTPEEQLVPLLLSLA